MSRLSKMTIHRAGPVYSLVLYLINFSGVNESGERFHIKAMFKDKMCKTTGGAICVLFNSVVVAFWNN